MPEAQPVSLRFKSLECTQLANKWIPGWKKLDVSIKVTLPGLKMESDHLSPANDISSVEQGGPNGWWCIQYRDRVIPLDNNHGILSSQWLHLPQMPLQRLGNFLSSRSSCNGPEISGDEVRTGDSWNFLRKRSLYCEKNYRTVRQNVVLSKFLNLLRKGKRMAILHSIMLMWFTHF